ncbi:hypothetical protein HYU14_02755 [Candidatus Woesearchaeota archaeon]|nr:hypothetical protein [Candidatus Woesearchaeota archaeon]
MVDRQDLRQAVKLVKREGKFLVGENSYVNRLKAAVKAHDGRAITRIVKILGRYENILERYHENVLKAIVSLKSRGLVPAYAERLDTIRIAIDALKADKGHGLSLQKEMLADLTGKADGFQGKERWSQIYGCVEAVEKSVREWIDLDKQLVGFEGEMYAQSEKVADEALKAIRLVKNNPSLLKKLGLYLQNNGLILFFKDVKRIVRRLVEEKIVGQSLELECSRVKGSDLMSRRRFLERTAVMLAGTSLVFKIVLAEAQKTLAYEILDIEKAYGVTEEDYKIIEEIFVEAGKKIQPFIREAYGREDIIQIFQAIDEALKIDLGFQTADSLLFNTGLKAKKFDCDMYSIIYISIGQMWNLPIKGVSSIYSKKSIAHMFVRWYSGSEYLNWETIAGRQSSDRDYREHILWGGVDTGAYLQPLSIREAEGIAYYNVAASLVEDRKYAEAYNAFKKAVSLNKKLPWAHYYLGRLKLSYLNPKKESAPLQYSPPTPENIENYKEAIMHFTDAIAYEGAPEFYGYRYFAKKELPESTRNELPKEARNTLKVKGGFGNLVEEDWLKDLWHSRNLGFEDRIAEREMGRGFRIIVK